MRIIFIYFFLLFSYCHKDKVKEVFDNVEIIEVQDSFFEIGEGMVCIPGSFQKCADDPLYKVVCNIEGTGYVVELCGEDSVCLGNECTKCKPGNKKCEGEEFVLQCNDTGTKYESIQDCKPEVTGQICHLGTCIKLCELNLKANSYIGCDYWGVDLDNAFVSGGEKGYYDAQGSQYSVVVSNTSAKYPAVVHIYNNEGEVLNDSQGNPFPKDPIPPYGLRIFNLPRRDVDGTVQAPLAYRIQSSIPITAYQFNPLENVDVFSNDASLLLPSHVLGKYYIVMTREETFEELRSYLTIIAIHPEETNVTITVSAPTMVGEDTYGNKIKHLEPGETIKRKMKQFDVLNIETSEVGADMTGSIIYSDRAVAVFGGSEASNAPNTNHCCPKGKCTYNGEWMECKNKDNCFCEYDKKSKCKTNEECIKFNTCCADHLEMQLFPVKTWGKKYIATKSYPRGKEKDVWRIIAAENGTQITSVPPQIQAPILNVAEWVDFESIDNFEIYSTKPVLVGQFLSAQHAPEPNVGGISQPDDADTGDPAFILAVPFEQFRKEYVFLAPDKYMFDCVNIIHPVGAKIFLDGEELKPENYTFKTIKEIMKIMKEKKLKDPSQIGTKFGDYKVIGTGEFAVYRIIISDGTHVITSEKPIGIIVYGYDQYVSYGYPGGLDLKDLKLIKENP